MSCLSWFLLYFWFFTEIASIEVEARFGLIILEWHLVVNCLIWIRAEMILAVDFRVMVNCIFAFTSIFFLLNNVR